MGQALSTTFGAGINAIAFTGTNFLFSTLNKRDYDKERRRHDKEIEALAKARLAFDENEIQNRDRIMELRREIQEAGQDLAAKNRALQQLREVRRINYGGYTYHKRPELEDFYKPSKERQAYEHMFLGLAAATPVAMYGLYKFSR